MACNGGYKAAAMPERRGFLLNEYTGTREYFVLRGGVLRIRQQPRGVDVGAVYLSAIGSEVKLLANNMLHIQCRLPHVQEYSLAATNEKEAEGWHDAIFASIRREKAKIDALLELLDSGCTMHKYNYSNSKRSRRFFWVADDGRELCWGRSKGEEVGDSQKVNLRECIGIIYGPMTTTFQRATLSEDPAWTCFSLLFMGRTLDLAVAGDLQVHAWFIGLQHLISQHGVGSMPVMSEAQFVTRKVQYKLMAVAHRHGLVLGRYLLERIREAAADRGLAKKPPMSRSSISMSSGGTLAKPMTLLGPLAVKASSSSSGTGSKKDKKKESVEVAIDLATAGRLSELRSKFLQLQTTLRERLVQAEASEAILAQAASGKLKASSNDEWQDEIRSRVVKILKKRCKALEADTQKLGDANEQMAPQVKAADKSERSLRKLQAKLEESETRRKELEEGLSKANASTAAASGEKKAVSAAAEEMTARGQQLQRRVEELERRLQEAQAKEHAEQAAAENHRQDEAIAKKEQEKLQLSQKLESLERDRARLEEAEKQSLDRLARTQQLNQKLDKALAPLKEASVRLREEQRRARSEVQQAGSGFSGEIQKLLDATSMIRERSKALEDKYKEAMEDRKKLHNLVLDLKGNIRVFVRVRPMNAKEKPTEPEGEPTIQFRDDINIGVYDGTHSRRKWFEFDQVFAPDTVQNAVFEEAKPLATSTLDGYNVCIFAYGQTGSGKTHTMTGTSQDPGLNTRVLTELFRIRDERRGEYETHISLSVTEIYNETIKDLLCPSSKKLDVKINADGSCGVPGVTESKVESVEDVLKCINDASKNRSTSSTDMNEQSSRSHSIVTVHTRSTLKGSDTLVGKIHLIDLAGSENTNKSGVSGQGMKEAQNINKSLSALGDVIQSLVAKNPHTPYRNSKLTMMLKDSLGGDSKTLMIVCSSPAQTNVTETLSSLNFAARARNVELGKAKRNTVAN
eukprot:TRINITY_DN1424_c0_g2_i1.p1 TRINITY_DN1424_c0_g2~~TRINITY_DN1424_c0_g2_i1.p1  ORF type:complete len:970 (+),score=222.53 TRINITY_DN1424_c0_g2_i1:31-2940(+)